MIEWPASLTGARRMTLGLPMEMNQIRYFLAVCEHRNFTHAARASHVSQPSLTAAIKKLEEEMGGALFLGFVAIVPYIASLITGVQAVSLSSTSLLIMVGVGLDTLRQLEAQLLMRNYEGFLR